MTSEPKTTWGTFEEYDEDTGEIVSMAVVPMKEKKSHDKFFGFCGCGAMVEWEHGIPIYIHQEVRN